jgi:7-cyano-7-deazaguanine synthase
MSPAVSSAAGRRAVVLLSGGLDSAVTLAIARNQDYACHALSVAYRQRHHAELAAARKIAAKFGAVAHKVIAIDLSEIGGSALTDPAIAVPTAPTAGIPITYVPARNSIFLSLALGWAEVLGAFDIFIGVNAVDYSGYPDCRPAFIEAFTQLARVATKAGVEGAAFCVHTPLIAMSKAHIIGEGARLGVNFADTVSCYQADAEGRACGLCDACRFRAAGFAEAGIPDPTRYAVPAR